MGELYRGMLRRRECANAREDESRIARDKGTTVDASLFSSVDGFVLFPKSLA